MTFTSFIDWITALVGYWDFNEGSGTAAGNNSTYGTANDGE